MECTVFERGNYYSDYDCALLDYLERWEKAQPQPVATLESVRQQPVETGSQLIEATSSQHRKEVKQVFQRELMDADELERIDQYNSEEILGELAKTYQMRHEPKICWSRLTADGVATTYANRCVERGKILTPSEIEADEKLPSWKYFASARQLGFGDLLWRAQCASENRKFAELRLAYDILGERQDTVDSTVRAAFRKISQEQEALREIWRQEARQQQADRNLRRQPQRQQAKAQPAAQAKSQDATTGAKQPPQSQSATARAERPTKKPSLFKRIARGLCRTFTTEVAHVEIDGKTTIAGGEVDVAPNIVNIIFGIIDEPH